MTLWGKQDNFNNTLIKVKQTYVFVQEANEGGRHDVSVFAAELHRRLYPIIHHKS